MQIKKINDVLVKTVPIKKISKNDIVGSDMFDLYPNIFICAKKKSGKTTLIYNILKECADKRTSVFVFSSTYTKDDTWLAIKTYLDKHNINNGFYSSIFDDKINILGEIVKEILTTDETDSDADDIVEEKILNFDDNEVRVSVRKKKPKKISQKYIFIFDDLSSDLRNTEISRLMKRNRHLKSKLIISSQYLYDIEPSSRRQLDVYILFSGQSEDKLLEIFKNADLNITFEQFLSIYKEATKKRFDFLYIDSANCKYRINFDKEIII